MLSDGSPPPAGWVRGLWGACVCGPAAAAVTGCPAQAEGVLPLRLPGAAAGGGGRREAGRLLAGRPPAGRCLRALAGR